jgi:hypothetical protein
MKPIVRALLRANDELNEEEATVPEASGAQHAVGDGVQRRSVFDASRRCP